MKKIAFLLPGISKVPIGGYKVVYQYADFFAGEGYDVSIVYPYFAVKEFFFQRKDISLIRKIRTFIGFYYHKRYKTPIEEWYDFKNNVKNEIVLLMKAFYLSKLLKRFDAVFATAVETAYALNGVKISKKKKFYLIQDFENWVGNSDEYCYKSFKFPFTKIVISKWLQELIESVGEKATLIPNGLDFDYFRLTTPIENRKSTEIAMLYHLDTRKRCCDSMAALEIVKKKIPDLHVTMFGVSEKPENLPNWYSYYKTPNKETHNAIYNTAAIFIAASEKEGWALPPAEAMQCGAALICSDIKGFSDYAKNEDTALIFPVYDIVVLANNILRLIHDNTLRIKIANNGHKNIQQFTWNSSFKKMKEIIDNQTSKIGTSNQ